MLFALNAAARGSPHVHGGRMGMSYGWYKEYPGKDEVNHESSEVTCGVCNELIFSAKDYAHLSEVQCLVKKHETDITILLSSINQ